KLLDLSENACVDPSKDVLHAMAWAHLGLASLLIAKFRATPRENEKLLVEICKHYEASWHLNSESKDKHRLLGGWATVLAWRAESLSGNAADSVLSQACDKYAAALEVAPNDHGLLHDYARALGERARIKDGREAIELRAVAIEKFEAALK